jgi:hypothetical protein
MILRPQRGEPILCAVVQENLRGFDGGNLYSERWFSGNGTASLSLSFNTTTASLGTLSLLELASSTVSSTISTDSSTGYSLTFDEDGDLRNGGATIDDVLDGSVTVGSEEYGLRTIGGGGTSPFADVAIVDGLEVASSLGTVSGEETGIQFLATISGATLAGSYSHVITATLSANP